MASLQSIADRNDVTIICSKVLSAAWEEALGFRCEELDGSSLFALLPFDEASARELLRRITDPAEPEPLVFDVRCKGP